MKDSKRFKQLLVSALALPGITTASDAPLKTSMSYRFTHYTEDAIDARKVVSGDTERFDIDVHQFRLLTPIFSSSGLELFIQHETLAGASPWGTQRGSQGEPEQIMSGATIDEERTELSARFTHYDESITKSMEYGYSKENDYTAGYFIGALAWNFNQKNTVFELSTSFSIDEITPSDAELFNRVIKEDKTSYSLSLALSQILSKTQMLQLSLSTTYDDGYLSDPYKLEDRRPDSRLQNVFGMQFRQFLRIASGALHINYRFFDDDWDMQSHTFEMQWHQNLPHGILISPYLRYYSQKETFFYEPYPLVESPQTFISSDYRLSPFGAVTYGLAFRQDLGRWSYTFSYENYESDTDFSIDSIEIANPGLVNFQRFTLGFDHNF
ncbi:MAG: DUF3570 domain-containing protein [Pseudomonadota bacterium]